MHDVCKEIVVQLVQRGYPRLGLDEQGCPIFTPHRINWDAEHGQVHIYGPKAENYWHITVEDCPCCSCINYHISFAVDVEDETDIYFPDEWEDRQGNSVIDSRSWEDLDTAMAYARLRTTEYLNQLEVK
jgi:hypothetical protein